MGCGNSSPATLNTAGPAESSSKGSEDSLLDDDKRKNYGGVYVGLPNDLSSIPQVKIGSLRESERDPLSLGRPLWGERTVT